MNLRTYLRIKTAAKDPMWVANAMAEGVNQYNDLIGSDLPHAETIGDPSTDTLLGALKMYRGLEANDNAASGGYLPYSEWHDKYGTEPKMFGKMHALDSKYPYLMGHTHFPKPPADIMDEYNRLNTQLMLNSDYGDYADYARENKK